jgi:hypothetical protein
MIRWKSESPIRSDTDSRRINVGLAILIDLFKINRLEEVCPFVLPAYPDHVFPDFLMDSLEGLAHPELGFVSLSASCTCIQP